MPIPPVITQEPLPGAHMLRFCGDIIVFRLQLEGNRPGRAFVRTNLGHVRITRQEIIREVELNEAPQGRDWFDIPMTSVAEGRFEAAIGLSEVGHFEAKCLFFPPDCNEPLWPEGPNTTINVEPSGTVCGNTVYNAFVRQFGSQKSKAISDFRALGQPVKLLDDAGFTVIPPSGTFRDLIAELDFILGRLGCRMIQLLPIHPTPTTYARMGRFGSPYASLSFTAVDPALAVFDPRATPLDQFLELVDAVHARYGLLVIDIAINHTGWAASLVESHPEWLVRKQSGEIENPGAWGVVWADLIRLDFSRKDLWQYMADVFLIWCRRGVDGFRCDAGYMIPVEAWRYIIAKVREQFGDVLFLLEGLGGKIEMTRKLLNHADFNWAYSELFQNYDRGQIEAYLPAALDIAATDGITVHFAETHDNNRLASVSPGYARMRTALCALTAPYGAFGFANGVEWFATEKINVHEVGGLNWGAADNQVAEISRLNQLLKTHPAFSHPVAMQFISSGQGPFLALLRHHLSSASKLLILVNLDHEHPQTAGWNASQDGLDALPVDLLSGRPAAIERDGPDGRIHLSAGQVMCLAPSHDPWLREYETQTVRIPPAVVRQRLLTKALEVIAGPLTSAADLERAAQHLRHDPEGFCLQLGPPHAPPRVIFWNHPVDLKRHVMVPPGHFLLLRAEHHFHVRLFCQDRVLAKEKSLPDDQGRHYCLLSPQATPAQLQVYDLEIICYVPDGIRRERGVLLYLSPGRDLKVRMAFSRNDCHRLPLLALGTNGRGAMLRVAADWRRLDSRYDALLAANLNPDFPEDRRIMLTRCRAWVQFQGYSQEVNLACLQSFVYDYRSGAGWHYQLITGQGEHIGMHVSIQMAADQANTVHLLFERLPSGSGEAELADDRPVTLIVRPDIEDRNFHHNTKAYTGPEKDWPAAVTAFATGFAFTPDPGRRLQMTVDEGRFVHEPEWTYMVHHPQEAMRGQDPDSDLLSPGYFTIVLQGGARRCLTARVLDSGSSDGADDQACGIPAQWSWPAADLPLEQALSAALNQFVMKRGDFNTVIAGFPWFLDWGRDTLIVVRGLIADGKVDLVRSILAQFARFERRGTLPNMIRGDDAANRDTSDAPLWLYTACADLIDLQGHEQALETDCGGRSLRQVLISMAADLIAGTSNGIVMDPDSALIFSPAHFTWMDTNYPAGSPRQGYPIEIQALWYAALRLLARIDTARRRHWSTLARTVKNSIQILFRLPDLGYLCDCRHCEAGQSAAAARPDDALRPNQLLAITLGAVDDPGSCADILKSCQALLVPGAIRSLADRPVKVPLPVRYDHTLLNNPQHPYWGQYLGDEDTRRKPAYHNGTAWTWLFPSFCEAWVAVYGQDGRAAAQAWLSSSLELINWHSVGQVPEIVDGDAPHHQRGCDAQAWGVSELLRVWKKVTGF